MQAKMLVAAVAAVAAGCGGGKTSAPAPGDAEELDTATEPDDAAEDPHAVYGPLDVGADFEEYTVVSTEPFESPTHGGRFVEIHVNDVGLDAYTGDGAFPVGSVIVKTSREAEDGAATDTAGPIFVMEKREAGFSREHGDWFYGFHWAEPPPKWAERLGGPTYWRSPSAKVAYCWKCHDHYDRRVGLPPKGHRAW